MKTLNTVAFAATAPFSVQGYLYGALAALSISTLVRLLTGVNASDVQQRPVSVPRATADSASCRGA